MSIPHPSQSHSTLYNNQSAHLPLFLPFLPISGWLMALLLLQMFHLTTQSSRGVCSSILEVHIASIFRMGTVSQKQNRYKVYLMFALNVIRHSGSAAGGCCKCWCRAWTGLLHCYYCILLLLRRKMQFGKLFVVAGRLHSKERAVYCTGNVRNTAVLNC